MELQRGTQYDLKVDPQPVEKQQFSVKAPQLNLDPKLVNTYYPPSGHQDDPRILPHIVFNDPHPPWLRRLGLSYDWLKEPTDPDPAQSAFLRQ
jgi:hypothetical protein